METTEKQLHKTHKDVRDKIEEALTCVIERHDKLVMLVQVMKATSFDKSDAEAKEEAEQFGNEWKSDRKELVRHLGAFLLILEKWDNVMDEQEKRSENRLRELGVDIEESFNRFLKNRGL